MPLEFPQIVQIGASLLGGGAIGAIISASVATHRGRVQPVAKRVEVTPLFASDFAGAAFNPSVTVSDGSTDLKFSNLHVAEIQVVNRGNVDRQKFSFGITLAHGDQAIHVEPYGLDRHHKVLQPTACTPAAPSGTLDFELVPFNRHDAYTMKVFIVSAAVGNQPGTISMSSSEPIRFVDIPSVAETLNKAGTITLKLGAVELSFLPRLFR
ncbi:hypothetical protein BZY94_05095 [Burkholderia territorii]|nr:hypothetical protein BZY94_05095 [Burkholderia territorii]